jgi:hypothetical protein
MPNSSKTTTTTTQGGVVNDKGEDRVRHGSKHKRHTTADGKIFYEDVNNPGVTTWVLPENGRNF